MKLNRVEKVSVIISTVFILAAIVVILVCPGSGTEVNSQKICSNIVSDTDSGETNLININTASADELCALSGIGESTAAKIITYRIQYGDFRDISAIIDVSGIGLKTFEKIKDKITI